MSIKNEYRTTWTCDECEVQVVAENIFGMPRELPPGWQHVLIARSWGPDGLDEDNLSGLSRARRLVCSEACAGELAADWFDAARREAHA